MTKPSKTELAKFRRLLEGHLAALRGDVGSMRDEALRASEQDNSVDHLADQGTDNYDQGFLLGLIENEEETMQLIVDAIDRIDGRGEWPFGACPRCREECQEPKALSTKAESPKATAAKSTAKSGAAKTAAGSLSAGKAPAGKAGAAKAVASKSGKAASAKGAKSATAAKSAPAAKASTAKTAVAKTALARPSPAKAQKAPADDSKADYWIPIDRLEYVPWARYCVRHQEEAERREIA